MVYITENSVPLFSSHTSMLNLIHFLIRVHLFQKDCAYTASLESECPENSLNKKHIGLLNVTMSLKDCGIIVKPANNQGNKLNRAN